MLCFGDAAWTIYTEMMKFWTKLVACLLIAWLPLLGYPAQVAFCPEISSSTMQSQMKAPHTPGMVACAQDARAHVTGSQPACHGSLSGLACGMAAIPTTHKTAVVTSSPVYRAIHLILIPQFIPELP
ncbi:hypothetical protein, partial [Paraburkholderia sediminicola]|uniref:hypothetical protein n=1 Tax=Paraburkholderia sediminicola TaxID=458836 RepID=UPI0038BDD2C3